MFIDVSRPLDDKLHKSRDFRLFYSLLHRPVMKLLIQDYKLSITNLVNGVWWKEHLYNARVTLHRLLSGCKGENITIK